MPDFNAHIPRRAHGHQLPAAFRGKVGADAIQIIDIGGRPHVWDPREGVLVNMEAISEKIDPSHYKGNRA